MARPTILCVDDDITILMSLKAQLKYSFDGRFHYELAQSAEEAWEVIADLERRNEQLAVVISDWLMPETRGDRFLIKVHESYPSVVKIMLTGHAEEEAITRAKEQAELAACLSKPWQRDELIQVISLALEA
ncbi:MAG: response regulator [Oleiphilaceae bacterium]|nr:response regulator [Oleiphilaceae bacterium]